MSGAEATKFGFDKVFGMGSTQDEVRCVAASAPHVLALALVGGLLARQPSSRDVRRFLRTSVKQACGRCGRASTRQ